MNKIQIQEAVAARCQHLADSVSHLNFAHFFAPAGEKWSVAENILHLTQSVKALNPAFGLPKAMLAQQFGLSERPTRTYEEVTQQYLAVLAGGVRAQGAFVPQMPENPEKEVLLASFQKHHQTLINALENWTEEELDSFQLKHPVLKLLTVREMLYFMVYHIGHHQKAIERIVSA
jgi:DinB superfamily